jgi:hypothetical protein
LTTDTAPDGAQDQGQAQGGEAAPAKSPLELQAIKQRDEEKAKRRELEAQLSQYQSKEREEQQKQGQWETLYKTEADRAKKLADELEAERATRRAAALLDGIAAKAGVQNKKLLNAAIRQIAEEKSWDAAPAETSDEVVSIWVSLLKEAAPELLSKTPVASIPTGSAGFNQAIKSPQELAALSSREAQVRALAQRFGSDGVTRFRDVAPPKR